MVKFYNFVNIGVWYIHGNFCNINKVKINKLNDPEFRKRLRSFEILCLQETQCGPNETASLSVEGYKLFPFHRKISGNNRHFGGSLLIIKSEIRPGIKIVNTFDGDKIWIMLLKEYFNLEKDMYICFAYVPPMTTCYAKGLDYDIF